MATQKAFDILSPDGIGMYFDKVFSTSEQAEIGFTNWVKRFEHQGYYRNNQWQQIPLNELRNHCRLIELEIDLDDFEGEII
jgi:hypothetical protein